MPVMPRIHLTRPAGVKSQRDLVRLSLLVRP
jgi:hypothetical protein